MNDELNNNINGTPENEDYQPAAVPEGEMPFTPSEDTAKATAPTDIPVQPPVVPTPPVQPNGTYQQFNQTPYAPYNIAKPKNGKGFGIAALILGICGIISSCCCGFGLILGILAIILGIISISKGSGKNGMSIAGIILGGVSIIASIAIVVSMAVSWPSIKQEYDKVYNEVYDEYYNNYANGNEFFDNFGTSSHHSGGYNY